MKKVLLLNQGNTSNIGDNAIKNVICKIFEKEKIEYDFLDYWIEEKIFGKIYINCNKSLLCKLIVKIIFHFQPLLDLLYIRYLNKNVDINNYNSIVIGGGELLCGHTGFNTAIYNISKIAEQKKVDLYLIGVSGDLKMNKKKQNRYRKSLKKFKKIFVRDKYTKKILDTNYKVKSMYYPDVVFSYNKVFDIKTLKKKENSILFVPISYNNNFLATLNISNEDKLIEYYVNIINEEMKKYDKLYISITAEEDKSIAFKILLILEKEKVNVSYIDCKSLSDYLELISKTKRILSGRMHAMILGCAFNNSFRVIPFKKKLITFEEEYQNININDIEKKSYQSIIELCNCLRGEINE